jgi:AcrR family transcriptional regulator
MSSPAPIKKKQQQYHHGDLKAAILKRSAEIISTEGIEALSLRGVARDLGVSHGAPNRHFKSKSELLSALVTDIWNKMRDSTLQSMESIETDDPQIRLNALGRDYLRWALQNKSEFQAMSHPDLRLYTDNTVKASQQALHSVIESAVKAAQIAGRHPDTNLSLLTLFTTSVPFGCAMLISNSLMDFDIEPGVEDQETLIADLINLVVPT